MSGNLSHPLGIIFNMFGRGGKETGFACNNCSTRVFEFEEHYVNVVEDEVEQATANHCLCTRGLFKTNLSRDALAKNYWKRLK